MTERGTTIRKIRVDDELWAAFDTAAQSAGTNRSDTARQLMAWFSGLGELPPRPGKELP